MKKVFLGNVRGPAGADAFSPLVEVARNTDTDYALKITSKDGAITTPNLKGESGADRSFAMLERENVNWLKKYKIIEGEYISGKNTDGTYAVKANAALGYCIIDLRDFDIRNMSIRLNKAGLTVGQRVSFMDENDVALLQIAYTSAGTTYCVINDDYVEIDLGHVLTRGTYTATVKIGFDFRLDEDNYLYLYGGGVLSGEGIVEDVNATRHPWVENADFVADGFSRRSVANAIKDIKIFDTSAKVYLRWAVWQNSSSLLYNTLELSFGADGGVYGRVFDIDITQSEEVTLDMVKDSNDSTVVGTVTLVPSEINPYEVNFSGGCAGDYKNSGVSPKCKFGLTVIPPENFYVIEGLQNDIYLKNICLGNTDDRFIKSAESTHFATWFDRRHWFNTATATGKGGGNDEYSIEDLGGKESIPVSLSILRAAKDSHSGETLKVLFIGDSLISSGYTCQYLAELFSNDVADVEIYGTHNGASGTPESVNEGFAGWSSYDVVHETSYNTRTNPFINPDTGAFDFAYYCTQNSIPALDWVFIQLGVNDIFRPMNGTTTVENIQAIINSIKSASPNTKIGVGQSPQPYLGGKYKGTDFRPAEYAHEFRLGIARDELKAFGGQTNNGIYLVPIYAVIDTDYNFPMGERQVNAYNSTTEPYCTDITHYSEDGHRQVAAQYFCCIKYN